MPTLSTLLHSSGVAVFGYALYYDMFQIDIPRHLMRAGNFNALTAFPGKWKFLTVWNLVLQLVYHTVSLANDLYEEEEEQDKKSWLGRVRDAMFASWAFPVGVFVSTSFWTLYTVDRRVIFPVEMDKVFPAWFNHAVHTGPIFFVLAGALVIPRAYPKRRLGLIGNVALSSVYSSWLAWVSHKSGVWPYPILEVMSPVQRFGFISSSGVIICGIYFIGESLNRWRWSTAQVKSSGDTVQTNNGVVNGNASDMKKVN